MRTVGDFADLQGGKQLEKDRIVPNGEIPVFGGAGVRGYTDTYNADGFVIAVGRVGAYCGQFFSHRGKAWINNNASLIRQKKEDFGEWLFLSLRHADIDVIKKGAAQPFVSNGDLSKLPLVWPSEKVVESFLQFTVPLLKGQEDANRESKFLALLRDTLLPKLISGELRIADAEAFLKGRG
jgi:type I restriction enzyme S subunit